MAISQKPVKKEVNYNFIILAGTGVLLASMYLQNFWLLLLSQAMILSDFFKRNKDMVRQGQQISWKKIIIVIAISGALTILITLMFFYY